ncbi:MAG: transporter [Burkholderiales bacterium]
MEPTSELRFLIVFSLAGSYACVCCAEELAATPYRPSVSAPAALSAPGWLEVEMGGQRLKEGETRRDSLPFALKLAFSPDWGLRVGGEASIRARAADGSTVSGFGDTSVIAKYRLSIDEASAYGIEAGFKSPTARDELGSGKSDTLFNFIYSADEGKYHLDVNLSPTRLGLVDVGQSRWQTGWAAAMSRSLDENWSVVGEFSGTRQHGAPSTSQFLAVASYAPNKRTVFDAGMTKGLTSNATDLSLFFGVTYLAARIW